jgi:hypothetical protein
MQKVSHENQIESKVHSNFKLKQKEDATPKKKENIDKHKSAEIRAEKYTTRFEYHEKQSSLERPKSHAQIRKEKFQLINQNRQINNDPRVENTEKEQVVITSENQFEILNQVICPLFEMPYEEQLELKSKTHQDLLARLGKVLPNAKVRSRGKVVSSDVLTEYRTKDEFGIQKVKNMTF